ncbi:hypothetical protein B296_00036479 [Ensete ventricosum]|uniref:Uncharacterized protein n=1 Tax=Ensete ventricosum TaxID=4639 RepID=A0A426XJL5_ENSVE|nr:hypothetical protein B296_00036479 [Ensete ventricosum]
MKWKHMALTGLGPPPNPRHCRPASPGPYPARSASGDRHGRCRWKDSAIGTSVVHSAASTSASGFISQQHQEKKELFSQPNNESDRRIRLERETPKA